MDARDYKLTQLAFWCGVLEGDARPVAPGCAVRTVRGAYTASRPAAEHKPAGRAALPPAPARPVPGMRRA